jgi:predicted ATPase
MREVPAVALFRHHARMVDPSWDITPSHARDVAEICVRLDGLPLAIELAACWMRVLTAKDLLTELSRALAVLVAPHVSGPERHHTLRAAIRWSYDLL